MFIQKHKRKHAFMHIFLHKCVYLVDDQGLEAVLEVAESLINKGIQRFLPQDCPKKIIKINQPNFV